MEEGSLRCEPNISVRGQGKKSTAQRLELKNLNSFRSVQLGIEYERLRQIAEIESGGKVLQETRGWNEGTESSYVMRLKETEQEYRYFPCPDLVPMHFSEEEIAKEQAALPELPLAKTIRYQTELGLSNNDAKVLVADRLWADWFEACLAEGGVPKLISNWMNSDFARLLNESGQAATLDNAEKGERTPSKITPKALVELTTLVSNGQISGKIAKEIFEEMFATGKSAGELAEGQSQISDDSVIQDAVAKVIRTNPGPVEQFRSGKEGVIGFLVGQVMKETGGRANPPLVQSEIRRQLTEPSESPRCHSGIRLYLMFLARRRTVRLVLSLLLCRSQFNQPKSKSGK